MNEDDQWNKQYRRLDAVEELSNRSALLELYARLYKEKFRLEPIFPSTNAHEAQLKALQKAVGADKAYALIQTFFEIRDTFFEKQQYSLECLMKNLNRVNVEAQRKHGEERLKGKLSMEFHCDACWTPFELICEPTYDYINKLVRCEPCKTESKQLKRVSKEERRATILKLGNAFPDLHGSEDTDKFAVGGDCNIVSSPG